MRAAHASDPHTRAGVDVVRGVTGDMQELGIYEAFRVSSSCGRSNVCRWWANI